MKSNQSQARALADMRRRRMERLSDENLAQFYAIVASGLTYPCVVEKTRQFGFIPTRRQVSYARKRLRVKSRERQRARHEKAIAQAVDQI